ncbi:DNA-binding protein DnaJ [Legionella quinlivanii]|uniref:DNA-binding protein DnaJ n=1 Tax=Legionella quinlivanii TaxID=45073 RepID=A0A0W0Y6E2_9GAMM|nr:DnaJ C-terminal domain-containing protein [Legionella quinlivanii]KTD52099.1 DNA-binding protein DnaJ [Legionella quinlivanii]SEF78492.1 curved DNA-binding protein [Legionella quinlivanii DSM 21216]STY12404.1 DNA-binding protein DnaJ [Legionella quinlivanii]
MDFKDYYQIMGLDRTASQDEIKQTYRKLARKYHPDVSKEPGAEEKFKELGEAYEVLKDPEKRAKYDKYGQYWKQQSEAQQQYGQDYEPQYQYAGHSDFDPADFEDFLGSIFGRQARREQSGFYDQGQDVHAQLTISLEDSYQGSEKILQLQMPSINKQGELEYQQRSIRVKIPKGIGNQQQIRLKGQGGERVAGKRGDLYIEIHIAPHSLFHVDKKNIHLKVPITPWEAVLGANIEIPTLGGTVNMKIPPYSQTGKKMRLKGRGLPGNPPGDQYITLEIRIPETENNEMNKLFEQMAKSVHFNPREKMGAAHER